MEKEEGERRQKSFYNPNKEKAFKALGYCFFLKVCTFVAGKASLCRKEEPFEGSVLLPKANQNILLKGSTWL